MPTNLPNTFPLQTPGSNIGKLRIAQLNAENLFLFFDQDLPPDWQNLSEKEWQKLSQASVQNKNLKKALWLGQSLLEIDADIVLVNEVGGEESLVNFAKFFLNDIYKAYVIEGNSDRGIDIGYLVKRDLPVNVELHTHKNRPLNFLYPHEVLNNQYFEKTAPDKIVKTHYFSRDCAELRIFRANESKPALIFLLVHLKSKLDPDGVDPEGRERRAAELKTLVEIYKELRRDHGEVPMIVGGDFNGIADSTMGEKEFLPLFQQTDLENVFRLLGRDKSESMTQIQFNRQGQEQLLQIDYLLVSHHLKEHLIAEETEVFRYRSDLGVKLAIPQTFDQRLMLPSDHYPIFLTLKDIFNIRP
jgi:exonuclease III